MRNWFHKVSVSLVLASAFAFITGNIATATDPAHIETANLYVATIDPANNDYGSPLSVYYDEQGVLHAESKCGSYAAHLFKASYDTVTDSVFTGLFGSTSPAAQLWFAGLAAEGEYNNQDGTFSTHVVPTVDAIQCGDVLAAAYNTNSGATGHVMIADTLSEVGPQNLSPGKIPGYASAIRWDVMIHDCTSSAHGSVDTRDGAEQNGRDDRGLGMGMIVIYEDANSGAIIGWKWSTTTSTIYQCVNPNAANYRPMVAGYLAGPGLPTSEEE